jgi:hypothetical protein
MQAYAERLRLHAFVLDEAANRYRRLRGRWWAILFLLFAALGSGALALGLVVALPALAVIAGAIIAVLELFAMPRAKRRMVDRLDATFEKLHDRELLVRDRAEDLRALWEEVHPRAREVAEKRGLQSFVRIKRGDRAALVELIGEEIPKLRSALYDALRDSVADAGRPSEASPTVSVGPDYRGPVRSGNRGFL